MFYYKSDLFYLVPDLFYLVTDMFYKFQSCKLCDVKISVKLYLYARFYVGLSWNYFAQVVSAGLYPTDYRITPF